MKQPLARISAALPFALGASLAWGGAAQAAGASFDTALQEKPCEIVTPDMVATALDVPAGDLEQSHMLSSRCSYETDDGDGVLSVEVSVDAYDTDQDAADYFADATRSMSANEVSEGMKLITPEKDTDKGKDAADAVGSSLFPDGIHFEDVDGIADEARFGTNDGTLHLRQGNLLINLSAFRGASMPLPDKLTPAAISKASAAWMQDTMDKRKAQAEALAKLVIGAL